MATNIKFRPIVTAGTMLGLGMGGFFDGILFHQILQTHQMLSNRLPSDTLVNIEVNMFWDGLFHAFTWIMTLVGIALLWKALRRSDTTRSGKVLGGSMFLGWGGFNLVEGVLDHQILQLHHTVQRASYPSQLYWDLAFLASGVVLILVGRMLIKDGQLLKEFLVTS